MLSGARFARRLHGRSVVAHGHPFFLEEKLLERGGAGEAAEVRNLADGQLCLPQEPFDVREPVERDRLVD